jgi:hypothetical protein
MKKTLPFVFIFIIILQCCNLKQEDPTPPLVSVKAGEAEKISELAVYMREVHQHSKIFREELINENDPEISEAYTERLNDIFFAEPTDHKVSGDKFNQLASEFLQENKMFFLAEKEEKIFRFNSMINSCVSCHQEFCPGPIKKINKLMI